MRKFYIFEVLIILAFLISSCKKEPGTITEEPIDTVPAAPIYEFNYENLANIPLYDQSYSFCSFSDTILIYGANSLMTYNINSKSWSTVKFSTSDIINGRAGGALAKFGNNLYIFAAPISYGLDNRKVVKFNIPTSTAEMLSEPLPSLLINQDTYPAYAQTDDKVIMIFPRQDSVYMFDSKTEKGRYVAENIFKGIPSVATSPVPLIYGKYQNYLYVFVKPEGHFRKFNLSTYKWESVSVPTDFKNALGEAEYTGGAIFNGMLFLYTAQKNPALYFDFENNLWGKTSFDIELPLPEYQFTTEGSLYFIQANLHLYGTATNKVIWKVTRKKNIK